MPLPQADIEAINEMIARGKTEPALVYLRNSLRKHDGDHEKFYQQTLLLSGRYHSWEQDRMSGVSSDPKIVNEINQQLFVLLDNIQHPQDQAQAFVPPPMRVSADPIRPAMPYHPEPHPRMSQPEKKGGILKYVTWFFVGLGALALIGLIMELDNEDPEVVVDPGAQISPVNPAQQPGNVYTPPASQPATEPTTPPPSTQSQPSITSTIRNKMMQMFNSGAELTEDDLAYLDPEVLRRQLANTSWYHASLGYVNFNEAGNFATYLNNTANFQIAAWTTYGFYVGQYAESTTGDTGYIGVVPPGSESMMTIYVESEMQGTAGFLELERR